LRRTECRNDSFNGFNRKDSFNIYDSFGRKSRKDGTVRLEVRKKRRGATPVNRNVTVSSRRRLTTVLTVLSVLTIQGLLLTVS